MTNHWPEEDKYKASRDRNFRQVANHNRLGQTDKGRNGFLQTVDFAHQDVGSFGSCWNLLQK